jgi:4-hydroxy-4-methyl-2-oxoglutarate aldolase
MTGSRVWLRVDRVGADCCERARAISVADVHEAMGPAAGRAGLMSARMRPLVRGLRAAGPAITAFCAPGDNLMMHRALSLAEPGDVLVVVSPAETSGAQWGDVAAQYAQHLGLAGVVVQGCIRDTDVLETMRFPVWATAISPIHPDKAGHGSVNAPVACDGVLVHPGDLVLADGDGVVVVPRAQAHAVLEAAERRLAREDGLGESIRAGARPWELSGAAASYATLAVEAIDDCWRPC